MQLDGVLIGARMHRTYADISLGRRTRTRDCAGGVRLIEATYAPHTRFAAHAHDRGNVSLIVRGQIEESVGRDALCSTTCGVVVKPAGTVHANRFGPQGARTLVIELPPAPRSERHDGHASRSLSRWHWFHGGAVTASALRLYRAFRSDDPAPPLDDLIAELVATIEERLDECGTRTVPPWVERVRDAIHDTFPQSVSVVDLARTFDVHPVYLARAFRARFGCAVTEYVQRLRVRDAAHRIACTPVPLCHVASLCGFCDQAHLSRVFKRDTGVSPGEFRRLALGN
jgi:AraC family transcriptional regulator